jgi:glycosyltransferase involved in cell wall biosynthesis
MAAYNSEKFIAEAIESIINQTFKEWELIIINDASTDRTRKIIKDYQKKDDRIKIINLKKNSGPAAARNAGLRIARGKYIAILDSDDVALPKRLEIQYNYLEKNKDIFLVGSSFKYIDENGRLIVRKKFKENFDCNSKEILKGKIQHSTVMYRRQPLFLYRKKLKQVEDIDLFLRVKERGKKIMILKDIPLKYRIHERSLSSAAHEEQKYYGREVINFLNEKKIKGKDSYSKFNPKKEEIKENQKEHFGVDKIILSCFYEDENCMQKFRRHLIRCINRDGIFPWKHLILYYFASFFPKKTKSKIKSMFHLESR